ncbi:MAG: hypothetical protein PVJ57_11715 [Phycisphaerae bacterium]|jgi:hypothetical protein
MMKVTYERIAGSGGRLAIALVLALTAGWLARASEPMEPLPIPDYSFNYGSWAVGEGVCDSGDVLTLDFPNPVVLVARADLGLWSPEDDLDALSTPYPAIGVQRSFVLLLSVDENTVGVAPPDGNLAAMNVPYNVADQAARGHAAGDQFMSTRLITLNFGVAEGPANTLLTRANFDEGGTDFGGQPPCSSYENTVGEPVDTVNGMAYLDRSDDGVINVCYSITTSSPSLRTLPSFGQPSGADICFDPNPQADLPIALYASHEELGLLREDDIDALIVFDGNQNHDFDGTDVVLFSLAPGSPSLTSIPGTSNTGSAADVFIVMPGQSPRVLVSAAELGLGHEADNIDALDFLLCDNALTCAAKHGIRSPRGDVDCNGTIDNFDIAPFLLALTNPAAYTSAHPDCPHTFADINKDGVVNNFDITPFVKLLLEN